VTGGEGQGRRDCGERGCISNNRLIKEELANGKGGYYLQGNEAAYVRGAKTALLPKREGKRTTKRETMGRVAPETF